MAVDDPGAEKRRLPQYGDAPTQTYEHPLYDTLLNAPGLSVLAAPVDQFLHWGLTNALWIFPMATSCCGIEFMSAFAARVDMDRMGSIVRASPRHADVMVVAGTITTKMAPRVKLLWEQMPEPRWCIAMGSCAISGDFYRNLYSVVPGIDTILPVDVYVPGCPPNPEALMHGMLRLQEKVRLTRQGKAPPVEVRPDALGITRPSVARWIDPNRPADLNAQQEHAATDIAAAELNDEPAHDAPTPEPGIAEAPPSGPGTEAASSDLEALLRDRFGVTEFPKDAPPVVDRARHLELARALRDLGFRSYTFVVASHRPAKGDAPEHFEVAYGLRSVGAGSKVATWRVIVPADGSVPSLTGLFAGADWQEREQFDLVGVRFEGHPDLRRIMNPDQYPGHPLRKDHAADAPFAPWR